MDAGPPPVDSGVDSGNGAVLDAGLDSGPEFGVDSGLDSGLDAGLGSGVDSGVDSGMAVDGGPCANRGAPAGCDGGCELPLVLLPINTEMSDQKINESPTMGSISDMSLRSNNHWAGIRFRSVPLTRCSLIESVTVRYCLTSSGFDNYNEVIAFEDIGDAPIIENIQNNLSDRTRTTAQATYINSDGWDLKDGNDCVHLTLDEVRDSLQAVVDRPDWAPGNALMLLDQHFGSSWLEIKAGNTNQSEWVSLTVEYREP
jgi:hypothetical protein